MSVTIPHRFLDKLEFTEDVMDIRFIVLGTYNPGGPDMVQVGVRHREVLAAIFSAPKYQRFDKVLNFYDRPQNRFWGIMDRLHSPEVYAEQGPNFRNKGGLKHFRGMERKVVYDRQKSFCKAYGIFISDIVKTIVTDDFDPVYNNFSDVAVDKAADEFNTPHLIQLLKRFPSARLMFTVNESMAIPRITERIRVLKNVAGEHRVFPVLSPSGAALQSYDALMDSWKKALPLYR